MKQQHPWGIGVFALPAYNEYYRVPFFALLMIAPLMVLAECSRRAGGAEYETSCSHCFYKWAFHTCPCFIRELSASAAHRLPNGDVGRSCECLLWACGMCEGCACVGVGVLVCKCVADVFFCSVVFFSPLQFYDRQIGNTIWGGLAKMLKEAIYSSFAQVEYCMSVLCSMRFSFFIYYLVCPNDYTLSYQQLYAYVL